MGYKEEYAKLRLMLLSKGAPASNVFIKKIPDVWEFFNIEKDEWVKIKYPEDLSMSGCLFKGKKGSKFEPHFHEKSGEHMTIMNPDGLMEVITEKGIFKVSFPDSIYIEKGVIHAVKFINETLINIVWHPSFKDDDWEGNFINETKN